MLLNKTFYTVMIHEGHLLIIWDCLYRKCAVTAHESSSVCIQGFKDERKLKFTNVTQI